MYKNALITGFCGAFLTAGAGFAQGISLEEAMLWKREHHILVNFSNMHLYLNENSDLQTYVERLQNGYDNGIYSEFFDYSVINYQSDFESAVKVGLSPYLTILNESPAAILASRSFHVSSSFPGLFGLFELGPPLIDNSDGEWTYFPQDVSIGILYQDEVSESICTSFLSLVPVGNQNEIMGVTAVFFIESGVNSQACFDRLFVDLIGLRGLAAQPNIDPAAIQNAIVDLHNYKNNYIFSLGG